MEPLDRLIAIEAIKTLKARYFRALDTKDWELFASVFTPDATMDVSGEMRAAGNADGLVHGRAEIAAFVSGAVAEVTTVHHGHMPEIAVTAPDRAHGTWAMEDVLRWPAGKPIRALQGFGHYHETYEKHDDGWLIASTKLTRLRLDVDLPS